ncbi:CCCH zinc finger protein [Aspergillus mulundensis]|uniref:C3H1-type domain-containing protein n=1 Tax=Aspergillus mulundensis TaxID=1810919 RepID=A0A3D8S6U9_9EURO|nr:Uncharacterized protein DSM5745_05321 [Aspergillus mulundensis]RDW81764.1 Uncharacterized protein DSM5745_05321 [Aspergillus mulundensis]
MNPQGFSFPPPPPPPPTQQNPPQQQYPHNNGYTPYGQNHHGQRGGRGGSGGQLRGRGRGYGNRGGGRGGNFMNSDTNRSGSYTAAAGGYAPMTYLGYPTQHVPNQHAGISVAQYTQSPSHNFPSTVTGNSFASTSHYPQPAAHGTTYQHQPSYGTPHATPTTQQPPAYPPAYPTQHATSSLQPTMMGPPIHWGFENTGHSGSFSGPQRSNQRVARQNNAHNHQNSHGKHANKRDHASAFGKPQSTAPRVPAPPPVPSFGNPLPSKPPTPTDSSRKPKKKKRKHNQLGLTPKTEDHESSEEEDDADEETRLAAGGAGAAAALQVTYRGRTSNLQSPQDIAAWIAERKKRFPTQAKIEEKKKAMEEAKKANKAKQEAQRQQKEARKLATARAKKEQEKKEQPRDSLDPADAAAKAKMKAEKLRRKLMKEEKRIAQAEADAERARKRDEPQEGSIPTAVQADNQTPAVHGEQANEDLSSVSSEDSDWTSSSGSDLSSSESDKSDDDDDSPPDQATSRREGPERVAPPARDEKKRVCRNFARNGRCPRGKACKFIHEKPERGAKTKPVENKGRKGLLEALLDRQKEDENHKLMETIMWLGENGLLDEPAAQQAASAVSQPHQSHASTTLDSASGSQDNK